MGARYVIRTEPGPLRRSRAPLDYRLMLRFPRARSLVMRWITSMPPTARVRRALLPRAAQLAFSAYEREDYRTPIETFYAPQLEFEAGDLGGMVPVDLPATVSNREDLVRWLTDWCVAFAWTRWEVRELLDFGDAIVFEMYQEGEGKLSGVVTELVYFSALRFDRGYVVWQRFFRDRDAAIRAAGRDPAGVPAP